VMNQVSSGIDVLDAYEVEIKPLAHKGAQQRDQNQKQGLFRRQLLRNIVHKLI
jgi:hypothetical protein